MDVEVWKTIPGYENDYTVSSYGRVKRNNRMLKGQYINGYKCVYLYSHCKRKKYPIHRLVAQAFIPNPNNLPCVNHKDENRGNNYVGNLEWCTHKYNTNYGSCIEIRSMHHWKPIIGIAPDGTQKKYNSILEAKEKLNISGSSISAVAKGKRKTAGGYKWIYAD